MMFEYYKDNWLCNTFYKYQFPVFKKGVYQYWFGAIDNSFILELDLIKNSVTIKYEDGTIHNSRHARYISFSESNVQSPPDNFYDLSYINAIAQKESIFSFCEITENEFKELSVKIDLDINLKREEDRQKQKELEEKYFIDSLNNVLNYQKVIEPRKEEFESLVRKTFNVYKNIFPKKDGKYVVSQINSGLIFCFYNPLDDTFSLSSDIYFDKKQWLELIKNYINWGNKYIMKDKQPCPLLDKISEVLYSFV